MGTMKLSLALAGEKIVIAGLALQVATFVVFLAVAIDFRVRMNGVFKIEHDAPREAWKNLLHTLFTLSALVLLRCVFRLIEYAMGNAAYLIAHEWTLYIFDGVPMLAVLLLLLLLQPSKTSAEQKSEGCGPSDSEMGVVDSR